MHFFGVRQPILLKVLLFVFVLWGTFLSAHLAWSQTQLPKTPKPALRNLAAGDVLFREGEVGDFAYQVVKGKIEVCKFNGDEYVTLSILEKGALFGEMALIDKQPRSAMARSVDEAVVKEIAKNTI